jgi:hypothetical protein
MRSLSLPVKQNARTSLRHQYRQQRDQRVKDSASLAEKYKDLKSLMVHLAYFSPDGGTRGTEIKYKVNLEAAKSVFCFNCPNVECVEGDFDLSKELAAAVSSRRKLVAGEKSCQGWYRRVTSEKANCQKLLRYKLTLDFHRRKPASASR